MTVFVYVNTSKQVGDAEHVKVFANPDATGQLQLFPDFMNWITTSRFGPSQNALGRAQAMAKPAQRVPRWLTIDLMILAVGAAIMIVAAVWILSEDFP